MTIITIDGNIGVGKTSLLMHIHKNHGRHIDIEPIQKWKPYLEKINKLPIIGYNSIWFEFQEIVWQDRAVLQNNSSHAIYYERSPLCTFNTFVEMIKNNNNINNEEYSILEQMYENTKKQNIPNKYVYLQTSPEICYSRINSRGRECENNISIEYIEKIHYYHERFFQNLKNQGYDVTIIDANQSIEDIAQQLLNST